MPEPVLGIVNVAVHKINRKLDFFEIQQLPQKFFPVSNNQGGNVRVLLSFSKCTPIFFILVNVG